jgi:hypothetical protein
VPSLRLFELALSDLCPVLDAPTLALPGHEDATALTTVIAESTPLESKRPNPFQETCERHEDRRRNRREQGRPAGLRHSGVNERDGPELDFHAAVVGKPVDDSSKERLGSKKFPCRDGADTEAQCGVLAVEESPGPQ